MSGAQMLEHLGKTLELAKPNYITVVQLQTLHYPLSTCERQLHTALQVRSTHLASVRVSHRELEQTALAWSTSQLKNQQQLYLNKH